MTNKHYIACDLGAESGRVIVGALTDGKLQLEEVHRFATGAIKLQGSLRWNVLGIFEELKQGLRKVAERGIEAASVSVDSWGVDYVLMSDQQPLLGVAHHYRDARTEGPYAAAQQDVGREKIFAQTGIQFLPFNTLYQLIAEVQQSPELVALADQFLNIADYYNYLLSGAGRIEVSMASTTQLYNPQTTAWSEELISEFKLERRLFPEIVPSGTKLGPLLPELREETHLPALEVIASCSHDTGAAVAAVPAEGDDWAYLSSGTWSLIGVELQAPIVTPEALAENFTNEAGFGGTTRFLKNIVGLWLLQECRRAWADAGQQLDYAELNQLAEQAEPFRSLIQPNDERFLSPQDMPAEIAAYCAQTNQPQPTTPGEFVRCILESLALLYREYLGTLERLTEKQISRLHVVGGGSQSRLLNHFTASATGRTVLAGPVEATAIGNLLIQAIALGDLNSHQQLREVVRDSYEIEIYRPQQTDQWEQAAQRFTALTNR